MDPKNDVGRTGWLTKSRLISENACNLNHGLKIWAARISVMSILKCQADNEAVRLRVKT
jgi:hypothetical protein